jgi:hypothetical protein
MITDVHVHPGVLKIYRFTAPVDSIGRLLDRDSRELLSLVDPRIRRTQGSCA